MATTRTPGPKPDFLVVEHSLKCQTDEGEVSIDLRIPFDKLELFMEMEEIDEKRIPRFILDNILSEEDKNKVLSLKDGAKSFGILMKFSQAVGERLGASLGESKGSSDSSESTEQPSDTTSEPASE